MVGVISVGLYRASILGRDFNVAPQNELVKADGLSTVQVNYGIDFSNFDGNWYTVTQLNTIASWAQNIFDAYKSFGDVATNLEG